METGITYFRTGALEQLTRSIKMMSDLQRSAQDKQGELSQKMLRMNVAQKVANQTAENAAHLVDFRA